MLAAVVGAVIGGSPNAGRTVASPRVSAEMPIVPRDVVAVPPAVLMEPPAGAVPRLAVMVIHGNGWIGPDPELIRKTANTEMWHHQGWAIMIPEFQAGASGLEDLVADHDDLRRRYPRTPICLFGYSAGAHLALMLAVRRPDVRCVISEAGPTDLRALSTTDPVNVYPLAVSAFGEGNLAEWSPIRFADKIHASVFQVAARNDPVVPVTQAELLAPKLRSGRLRILDPGATEFIHSKVDAGQLKRARAEEVSFLASFEDPRLG
jgi:dienelactone hydrolase